MTVLYNYIKDHAFKKIDYFGKEIDNKTIPVFISNNLFFGIL